MEITRQREREKKREPETEAETDRDIETSNPTEREGDLLLERHRVCVELHWYHAMDFELC